MNKRCTFLTLLGAGFSLYSQAQMPPPPPGYGTGTIGVPPPPTFTAPPPPSVPPYPNALPPPTISPGVTPPPPPGIYDPMAAPPPPGAISGMAPQSSVPYTPPPGSYGGPADAGMMGGPTGAGPGIINYNYAEFNYRYLDPKASGLKGAHTIGATLSVALFEPLYLKFGASWGSGQQGGGPGNADYDFASIQAGVGFHTQLISPKLQFVGEAGLVYASLRAQNSALSFSDGAIYARPGLRYALTDGIELDAGVTVSSADKYDSKLLDLGGYFRVMRRFDVGVGFDLGDATRGFRTNLRMRW